MAQKKTRHYFGELPILASREAVDAVIVGMPSPPTREHGVPYDSDDYARFATRSFCREHFTNIDLHSIGSLREAWIDAASEDYVKASLAKADALYPGVTDLFGSALARGLTHDFYTLLSLDRHSQNAGERFAEKYAGQDVSHETEMVRATVAKYGVSA